METPICEECDTEMQPYSFNGEEGYCCDECGWSEELPRHQECEAVITAEVRE